MARLTTALLLCALIGSAVAARTLQQTSRYEESPAPSPESSRYSGSTTSPSTRYSGSTDSDGDGRYDGDSDGGRYDDDEETETSNRYNVTEDDGRYNGANQGGRYDGGSRYADEPASATGVVAWTRGRNYEALTIALGDSVRARGRGVGLFRVELPRAWQRGRTGGSGLGTAVCAPAPAGLGGRSGPGSARLPAGPGRLAFLRWRTRHRRVQVTFEWSGGSAHDVAQGTALGDCDDLVSLVDASEEGTFVVTPNATGSYFYACSVSDHCLEGQQIQIDVVAPA